MNQGSVLGLWQSTQVGLASFFGADGAGDGEAERQQTQAGLAHRVLPEYAMAAILARAGVAPAVPEGVAGRSGAQARQMRHAAFAQGRQAVAALEHATRSRPWRVPSRQASASWPLSQAIVRGLQVQVGERIEAVGVEAGRDQQQLRREGIQRGQQAIASRPRGTPRRRRPAAAAR